MEKAIPITIGRNNILKMKLPTVQNFLAIREKSKGKVLAEAEGIKNGQIKKRVAEIRAENFVEEPQVVGVLLENETEERK